MLTVSCPSHDDFERWIVKHYKSQIPYATSRAINRCLKESRVALTKYYKSQGHKPWFNNRSTGINIVWSHKSRLAGAILTRIHWADLKEHGGTKRPFKSKYFPVPTKHAPKYLGKSGGVKRLMQSKKVFIAETQHGTLAIWRRTARKKRYPIKPMAILVDKAKISPTLKFVEIARKIADRRFKKYLNQYLQEAIRASK